MEDEDFVTLFLNPDAFLEQKGHQENFQPSFYTQASPRSEEEGFACLGDPFGDVVLKEEDRDEEEDQRGRGHGGGREAVKQEAASPPLCSLPLSPLPSPSSPRSSPPLSSSSSSSSPPSALAHALPPLLPKLPKSLSPCTKRQQPPLKKRKSELISDSSETVHLAAPVPAQVVAVPLPTLLPPPPLEMTKRQKQLLKNREAAFLSRQRKKNYIQELEAKIASLQKDNDDLRKRVDTLEATNADLTSRLQSSSLPSPPLSSSPPSSSPSSTPFSSPPSSPTSPSSWSLSRTGVRSSAGAVLLMVFFSFAFFLNPRHAPHLQQANTLTLPPGRSLHYFNRLPVPEKDMETISELQPPRPSTSSLSLPPPVPRERHTPHPHTPHPHPPKGQRASLNESSHDLPFDGDVEENHTIVETVDLEDWIHQSLGLRVGEHGPAIEGSNFNSDTAYVFCPTVLQFLPNHKNAEGHPKLSLLMRSQWGKTAHLDQAARSEEEGGVFDHIVQVDCKVTGTRMLPLRKASPAPAPAPSPSKKHQLNSTALS